MDKARWRKLFKLYALYARMDFSNLMRDGRYAVAGIFADGLSNATTIAGVFLLAVRFDGIGKMSQDEVLLMLAYITIVTGVFQCFFANTNTGHISRRIGRGQIDHMFIQPVPISVQLMTEGFMPFTGSGNVLTGIVVFIIAVMRLNLSISWFWPLILLMNILISVGIILAQSYLFSTVAFYAPVAGEEISSTVIDSFSELTHFPVGAMPARLRIMLLTVWPSGLLGWYPTMVLLGKSPFSVQSLFPIFIFCALLLITQFVFRKGWRFYVKKGSNRYSSLGHRR